MAEIPLGTVIYMAFKPLIKIYLCAALGFLSVKLGILTNEGTAVISKLILTFLMPCLIFSNVVKNIQVDDAKYFGILALTAAMYMALGFIWSLIIRGTTPVPKAWIGGITLAAILNNSGDLPIAYVTTVGNSSYYPSNSSSLGTAYCVLYGIGFNLFLFNFGGARILLRDADIKDPNKFDPTVPYISWQRVKGLFSRKKSTPKNEAPSIDSEAVDSQSTMSLPETEHPVNLYSRHERSTSFVSAVSHLSGELDGGRGPLAIENVDMSSNVVTLRGLPRHRRSTNNSFIQENELKGKAEDEEAVDSQVQVEFPKWKQPFVAVRRGWAKLKRTSRAASFLCTFLENLGRIQAMTVMISLLVSFVPWLRRLFVDDPNQVVNGIPNAPDGMPPLDFLMDTTSFMGECQVQLGLVMLGGTIARLKVNALPKGFWKTLLSLGLFKLVLLPIFSVFWISRVRKLGWISPDMDMFPIVMAACSGTPSATSQIYLTLMFTVDPEDAAQQLNCFGASLILNYIALPFTMTVLMAYTIKNFA